MPDSNEVVVEEETVLGRSVFGHGCGSGFKRSQSAWPTIFGDGRNGTATTRDKIALPFREEINNLIRTIVHAH